MLPLFGGIYKRGAGLGPAMAFLYSGPAINVLAIVYSARLLGYDIGIARAVGAVVFAIVIGLIMAFLYRKEQKTGDQSVFDNMCDDPNAKTLPQQAVFFASLVGILVFAASKNWIALGVSLVVLAVVLWKWFNWEDIKLWMKETWHFVKLVTPWLLGGVFIAGVLKVLIPDSFVLQWVGGNGLLANFIASVSGALMYFATLTEVPIIRAFMDMGMGKGPALALLLAGPALSLPSIIVLQRFIGWRKTITFVALVVIMATVSGLLFGFIQ